MANPRALDKRRKSIRNIKKITRTMELIATARFKKAMDRATAASDYTRRIGQVVADLAGAGLEVSHPLLEAREETTNARVLVLTANRGLCGGFNGNVIRLAINRIIELRSSLPGDVTVDVSGKRGISGFKFRGQTVRDSYQQFDDQPLFDEVAPIAENLLQDYTSGKIDRLDVVYTKFVSSSRQEATCQTLLPMGSLDLGESESTPPADSSDSLYEFLPSAASILEEIVPMSFKVQLFKCFLDSAVSEQIARMVAMKSATENANEMIRSLSMTFNRARQSQITNQIMEVIGGVEALEG